MNNAAVAMNIEERAAQIVAQLDATPKNEQSAWLQMECKRAVAHLVGYDRVTLAFFLGMHVGNLLKAEERGKIIIQ